MTTFTEINLDRGRWSPKTRESYKLLWRDAASYFAGCGITALPVPQDIIAEYMKLKAQTKSVSYVSVMLAAVRAVHALYNHELSVKASEIKDAWADIRRQGKPKKPKAGLLADHIKRLIDTIDQSGDANAVRDRAVFLLAFTSLRRRSELAALTIDDLEFQEGSLAITIRRSKTDQFGEGKVYAVARIGGKYCPCEAMEAWLKASGITSGSVFQITPHYMYWLLKRKWAPRAGFDAKELGMHSFRSGGITQLLRDGESPENCMAASGHKTVAIMYGYYRADRAAKNPAVARIGRSLAA